jgi:hypothetical protein
MLSIYLFRFAIHRKKKTEREQGTRKGSIEQVEDIDGGINSTKRSGHRKWGGWKGDRIKNGRHLDRQ